MKTATCAAIFLAAVVGAMYVSEVNMAHLAVLQRLHPRAFGRPFAERLARGIGWTIFLGVVAFCFWHMDFSPQRLWRGVTKLGWLVRFMVPPSHGGWLGEFSYAMLETLAMALIGTSLAGLVALPLGFLGAKNVVLQRLFHFGWRRMFDSLRGIDTLIWALMFVNAVGLGPFAGVMAIAVSDSGTLAKLFAEAIENIEHRQVEGVRAAGANTSA